MLDAREPHSGHGHDKGPGSPPPIPDGFEHYNSEVIDPAWALRFTLVWVGFAAVLILLAVFRALRHRRLGLPGHRGAFGSYAPLDDNEEKIAESTPRQPQPVPTMRTRLASWGRGAQSAVMSFGLWSPSRLNLNLGQILIVLAYFTTLAVCALRHTELIENANRPGWLSLAQLPPLFLLATKSSPLTLLRILRGRAVLEGSLTPTASLSYTSLNYLHRWVGRGLFACATLHGSLWVADRLKWGRPIFGPDAEMETTGLLAWTTMLMISLSSLPVVRKALYRVFFYMHILGYLALVVIIRLHTHHAIPFLIFALGVFATDVLVRCITMVTGLRQTRLRGALSTIQAIGDEMTIIRIPTSEVPIQWRAGQHVRLRVLFGQTFGEKNLIMESHPLSICVAPPTTSVLDKEGDSLVLCVRVTGDWTRALNGYASELGHEIGLSCRTDEEQQFVLGEDKVEDGIEDGPLKSVGVAHAPPELSSEFFSASPPAQARVLVDGPYGGLTLDLGSYERVILVAGGSGATFTLALLDDLVGRCVRLARRRGERTQRVDFVWFIQKYDTIRWFAAFLPTLVSAATDSSLDVRTSIFATREAEALSSSAKAALDALGLQHPHATVRADRPQIRGLLQRLLFNDRTSLDHEARGGEDADSAESIPLQDLEGADDDIKSPVSSTLAESAIDYADGDEVDDPTSAVPLLNNDRSAVNPRDSIAGRRSDRLPPSRENHLLRGGGVAVCASGPESLMRSVCNAVAWLAITRGVELGGIDLHTEAFSL